MALDLSAILAAAGTGAVTGYLTNNLALKMIFKEYGPFGGVVIKTKEEFIDSISKLVEKDLINHQTLEAEFSREEFKQNFEQSISDFLNIYLQKRSSELKLNEIPAWDENYHFAAAFLAENSTKIIEENMKQIKEKKLEKLLPKSEIKKISSEIYLKLIKEAKKQGFIEKIILGLYDDLEAKSLEQLLTEDIKVELKTLIKEISSYFRKNYQGLNTKNKAEFKSKLKKLFDLENLSKDLINEVKNIKLSDLFKDKQELESIKNNGKIKETLKEILVNLKIEINNSNLIWEDFLNDNLEQSLKKETKKLLNLGQNQILRFLESEEKELNSLILEAVEAEIEASNGFKGISRQGIYGKYKEKIDEYGRPVAHLKEYFAADSKRNGDKLAEKIIASLKKLEIKTSLSFFEFQDYILQLEALLWNFYQQNCNKKLIELFSEEVFDQKETAEKIIDIIFSLIKKISAEDKSIDLLVDSAFKFKLSDLLQKENLELKLKDNDQLYTSLLENDFLQQGAGELINNKFLALLTNMVTENKGFLHSEIENHFNKVKRKISTKKLNLFYKQFKTQTNVVNLTDSIKSFFYNNLPELIEGRVAEAAASNLHQLSDQEVQQAIEDFMGKELKPITYLGALLGAAAGILFSISGAESSLLNNAPLWLNYLSSALLYGGVGWLTNVLAIWMIFHPYQEKKIASLRLPFTPGVVAKNRSRFADSMGKFVEKELLKADSASKLIEENREEIKDSLLNYFEQDEYQKLFKLIKENKNFIAERAVEFLIELLEKTNAEDWNKLINSFAKKAEKSGFCDSTAVEKMNLIEKLKQNLSEEKLVVDFESLSSQFNINKITSAVAGSYDISINSSQLKKLLQNKELYPFIQFLLPNLLERESIIDTKTEVIKLFEAKEDLCLDQGLEYLFQQQDRIAQLINFKKDEIIEKEKEKESGLLKNTLISGALYVADLDEFVDSVVARVFTKLKEEYLPQKRAKLKYSFSNLLQELKNSDFLTKKEFDFNQILISILNSEKGNELLNQLIYLSEDKISDFLDAVLAKNNQTSLESALNISEKELNYFIEEQITLEQKFKLLLDLKGIISAPKLNKQLLKLLKIAEIKNADQDFIKLFSELELFSEINLTKKSVEKLKKEIILLLKEENNELILRETAEMIEKASIEFEQEINKDSIRFLIALFLESAVDSFKYNSESLLKSLELKNLTAEEVRKMDPAEIEEIFDSFAGRYFAHLKQYGWFGGIFGVLQLLLRTLS